MFCESETWTLTKKKGKKLATTQGVKDWKMLGLSLHNHVSSDKLMVSKASYVKRKGAGFGGLDVSFDY